MQALEWSGASLRYLDQRQLPLKEVVLQTEDPEQVLGAIRSLAIRGAPLIGISAAYSAILAALRMPQDGSREQLARSLEAYLDRLAQARPTAVNLTWAVNRVRLRLRTEAWTTVGELARAIEKEALSIHDEDRRACDLIGRNGAPLIPAKARILTHCNTGALATGGDGTALNVIRHAWKQGSVSHVFVDETRPLFQGSRLTAWELSKLGIPFSVITDGTAGFLMQQAKVDALVVGADRIAPNGDVANKIGTFSLASVARDRGIPFYVAAPVSTFDFEIETGSDIPIEERAPEDVTRIGSDSIVPEGTMVYAPAFDVTPSEYITALITDRGVLKPPLGESIAAMRRTKNHD
jgi:methylthioribose-1-phosphate isomerase